MRPDIQIGGRFPDYELPDHTGTKRKLLALQGSDPMILLLSRGGYCPKERQQHRRLVEFYPEAKVGYAQIVTISTDDLLATNEFRDGVAAYWPFLSDPDRIVQRDLDIREYTDPPHNPMIPHTLVLEPGLKIFKIYNGYWYWGRPSIGELHQDLREVTRTIRPDWDITKPELRAAWSRESDRARLFWPYGKSFAEIFRSDG
jgi:peroxiredoxin